MLSRLTVANLAVVEKAQADFEAGLNVLTGETGSGKTVLIGALELVLGVRADSSIIREGAKEARVEAVFEFPPPRGKAIAKKIAAILEDAGIEPGENLVVRRTISAAGGSRVWVNDSASSLATLKRLGAVLVDIHGPRANQNILEEKFQRATLDSFGSVDASPYIKEWRELENIREQKAALEGEGDVSDETDLLRYQVAELEEAAITEEDDALSERQIAAAHAGEIVDGANEVTQLLGGDGGVSELMGKAISRIRHMGKLFPDAAEWSEAAESIAISAEELSRNVADAASRIDADPAELERMDARLATVNRIFRKYRAADSATIAAILAEKKERLSLLEGRDERLAELAKAEKAALSRVESAGAALRKVREKAGVKLAKAITANLHGLGFAQAKFAVAVEEAAPSRTGADKVEYLFEPNPGESARALAAIASSGEAARVMLAIKSVLAGHDGTDLLVFDEIDANIGGETGSAVGLRMRETARHHQVIAITHMPQSAAFGERHLIVKKTVSNGRTRTTISVASGTEREKEIARMLGGGKAAEAHAKAILSSASGKVTD